MCTLFVVDWCELIRNFSIRIAWGLMCVCVCVSDMSPVYYPHRFWDIFRYLQSVPWPNPLIRVRLTTFLRSTNKLIHSIKFRCIPRRFKGTQKKTSVLPSSMCVLIAWARLWIPNFQSIEMVSNE